MKISLRHLVCALALLIAFLGQAEASNFTVSPVRLEMEQGTASTILNFKNLSAEPLTLQADIKGWEIGPEGKNTYTKTGDFVFFPKIFTMEANGKASLRIAYKGKPSKSVEKSYRVFASEIPNETKQSGVAIRLAISLPLFVKPDVHEPIPQIAKPAVSDAGLIIPVLNKGNAFFKLDKVVAKGLDEDGKELFIAERDGWYMLAGNSRNFTLEVPADQLASVDTLDISLQWNDNDSMSETFDYEAVVGKDE